MSKKLHREVKNILSIDRAASYFRRKNLELIEKQLVDYREQYYIGALDKEEKVPVTFLGGRNTMFYDWDAILEVSAEEVLDSFLEDDQEQIELRYEDWENGKENGVNFETEVSKEWRVH